MLETDRGAVRRLSKISICAVERDLLLLVVVVVVVVVVVFVKNLDLRR